MTLAIRAPFGSPYVPVLGPATPINLSLIGAQTWGDGRDPSDTFPGGKTGQKLWIAQRWIDLFYDTPPFGRSVKTPPGSSVPGIVTVSLSSPYVSAVDLAGAAVTVPSAAFTVVVAGGVTTITLDLQCYAFATSGDSAHPENLVLLGKLWVVDPNANLANTLAAFNSTYDSAYGSTGLISFADCTPALQNAKFTGSNSNPQIRCNNTRTLDALTPNIEGLISEGLSHDDMKAGSGARDLWIRRATMAAHPYTLGYTDPIGIAGLTLRDWTLGTPGLMASGDNPPIWEAGRAYATNDAVTVPFSATWASGTTYAKNANVNYLHWGWSCAKNGVPAGTAPNSDGSNSVNWVRASGDQFYALRALAAGTALPTGTALGRHDANWQFYGNLHADLDQIFQASNTTSRPVWENVFWYQGMHVSIYVEMASKVLLNKLYSGGSAGGGTWRSAWTASTGYVVNDVVSFGASIELYICIQANTAAAGNDPTHSTFWTKVAPKLASGDSPPAWSSSALYVGIATPTTGSRASCVRGSNGQEFYAIQNSTNQDPTSTTGYWAPASGHGMWGQYCLSHGNNVAVDNASLDPTNGLSDCIISPGYANPPVQGTGNSDTTDGVHVRNVRNVFSDGSGPIPGSS